MAEAVPSSSLVRFGTFEVDLQAGELRKSGVKLKLTGQPLQVLTILLERAGEVVTREELQKRLWPDTFVDVDHNLNTAVNRIREVLGDSAESPRFVETLPRRGYRFITPVEGRKVPATPAEESGSGVRRESGIPTWVVGISILCVVILLLAASGLFIYQRRRAPTATAQRALTRLTFDEGLQIGATWSPDGRFIAYSSDRGGKFDVWVQQLSGGDPVQITKGPGQNWQPDWSPDGKYIAYRSEGGEGGLFVIPALGGAGLERRISAFGYYPRWSPDSSQILFRTHFATLDFTDRFYVVQLDGSSPREVLAEFFAQRKLWPGSAAWHPELLNTHDCAIIHSRLQVVSGRSDMGKRRDPRVEAKLQVRIAGTDAGGRPLLQMVTTRNISRQGALLEGIQGAFKPGEIISVSYKSNKARFRVTWVGDAGTDKGGQVGLQSVDPVRCIWDAATLPPTAVDTYATKVKERRQHRRVPCKLGAELYMQGSEALIRVDVRNISVGGCFVEMPTLPPDQARLKIIVWAADNKLAMEGVVASRRPGFGISIKFTEMTDEVRQQLQRFIQSLVVRSE